jgi:SM-20-related protein
MVVSALLLAVGLTPAPRLQQSTLEPLFGPQQLVAVRDFIDPALVAALRADAHSLRAHLPALPAAPEHGSVEWLPLLPDPPQRYEADNSLGIAGRECLLGFVDELRNTIERQTGVALDAHCELKYAHYPCGGRYQRHIDGMNVGEVAREYSFRLYLNEGWSARDGGHLRVFLDGGDRHVDIAPTAYARARSSSSRSALCGCRRRGFASFRVAPRSGTLVVFKSDVVPHEVRPTTARRLAVVGWLHRHVEPPPAADDADLTPLARAILEHYRAKGEAVKLGAPPG